MAKRDKAPAKAQTDFSKVLLVALVIAVGVALAVAVGSLMQSQNNESQLKALTAAVTKQTEVMSNMKAKGPAAEDLSKVIRQEMEQARKAEMLQAFKEAVGSFGNAEKQVNGTDAVYGDPAAEISIVEFADYDCPYCKRFHDTPKDVVDASGGRVNWVWKDFPVHPSARPLHVATECVRQQDNKAFWVATKLVFNNDGSRGLNPKKLGEMLPIDQDEYAACLSNQEAKQLVQEDYNFGQEAGVTGTPATYIVHNRTNQVMELRGAVPASKVKSAVQQLISQANQAGEQGQADMDAEAALKAEASNEGA